jgi:hypothetical protein
LRESAASLSIQQVLGHKLKARSGGQRFFGEAFVAGHKEFRHREGWYSSHSWLSAPRWRGKDADGWPTHEAELKAALSSYLGNVEELQNVARHLDESLDGRRAVAPDLWLFTGRRHRFIEVKLPGDRISDSQLAGLAVIATTLQPFGSVEVVELVREERPRPQREWNDEQKKFRHYCRLLNRVR